MGSVATVATAIGAVASFFLPPIGLPLLATAVGAASTSGSIGAGVATGINAMIPEQKFIDTFDEDEWSEPICISQVRKVIIDKFCYGEKSFAKNNHN